MAGNERFEDSIGRWLEEAAPTRLPARVLDATFERTRRTRQKTAWRTVFGRLQMLRFVPALGGAAVVVLATVLALNVIPLFGPGTSPTPAASPTAAPSPSPSRLSCRTESFQPEARTVLGCSRDGTRLLIQKDYGDLFVVHADGSETQVTDQLSGFKDILGSGRPWGATISPDGSRVVFAGLTKTREEWLSCHDGALFVVDADGGPVEVLWKSQNPHNGIVRYPTFSPDGTQIAFADGYCDQAHSVWVMNADGSDTHQIVSSAMGALSATHVLGLAWSPAGDRIALTVDRATYTFATDGSDFKVTDASEKVAETYCWPGRQC